jgi:AraC-like DNA-binding protein
MGVALLRMVDKTATAPYYAQRIVVYDLRPFRVHDFVDVVAVVAGEGTQLSSAHGRPRMRSLRAGHMVLYRPGDEIRLRGNGPDGLVLSYVSSPAAEWRIFSGLVGVDPSWLTDPEPPVVEFDPSDGEVLRPFETALDRFRTGATSLDLVQFWINMIPIMFPGSHRHLPGAGAPGWLIDGVHAMREEANLRGGVPRFLELAHVSAAHLSVTTRRYFERTPTELVTLLRLRHAAFLLATTAEPIARVAARCGFAHPAYFSASFRREHHQTPTEYRARALARSLVPPPSG